MRRTDRIRFGLERRADVVLVAVLFGLFAVPALAAAPKAAVERSFAAYKSALVRRDGARAAAAVSANSLAYYDRMRKLALFATRSELAQIEGTERMLVLGLRHQAPRELLASGKPEDLVAYAVDSGLVSETGIVETDLGEVTIQGDFARGWIIVDGKPTRGVLQFALEGGEWKFDLEFAMKASAGLISALARQAEMSEDDVIIELLGRGSGRPVGPDIWKPLEARPGSH